MERAYREGKVRFNQQVEAQKYMEKYGCHIMSWGPFAEGLNDFFHNEVLTEIGKAHGKTLAQTALRFLIQRGVLDLKHSLFFSHYNPAQVEQFMIWEKAL